MELVKNLNISKIIRYAFIALIGSIILAISSKIKIPFYPVPMTMQTLVVLAIGGLFGWKLGVATISLYLFEGIIGLPVFAGTPEKGVGLVYFTGPTMGYLLGFIPAVFFSGLLKIHSKYNLIIRFILNFLLYAFSVSFIYVFGLIWLLNFIPIEKLWALGALPFLPAEILKVSILAIFTTVLSKNFLSWRSLR
jgi:biotin transport system substrate-specific component